MDTSPFEGRRASSWTADLTQDVRYALRSLRQRAGFSAVVIVVLALGGGATTVMFSVINGVVLTPLPYPDPQRLVTVVEQTERPTAAGTLPGFSYPGFLDAERASRTVALAAWRPGSGGTVSGPGDAEYVPGVLISARLLLVLGITPSTGRAFLADEDRPGGAPVAIISDEFWRSRYEGSAAAVGAALMFDGRAHTVVGVLPPGFNLAGAQVFRPLGQSPQPAMRRRDGRPGIRVLGRLRDDASLTQARAELASIGRQLAQAYPASNGGRTIVADRLRPEIGSTRTTVWLLLAAVGVVLLIACGNLASLVLVRSISREHEFALRLALGARRGRLIRQCLTESTVLALCGGGLGVVLAVLGTDRFVALWPGGLPRADTVAFDWRVLLFATSLSMACGLLFGLAPALRVSASRPEHMLRAGSRQLAGGSRYVHGGFVVFEVALAVVLLVSAGVLGRSLVRAASLDPGVDIERVLTARVALSPSALRNPEEMRARWQNVVDQAGRVPGVTAAALVDTVPMRAGDNQIGYWTTPNAPPRTEQPLTLATAVTPDYREVMGLTLLRGRFIDARDTMRAVPVVVIDEVLARNAFNGDAIGKQLHSGALGSTTVVGVVSHVRHWGLANDDDAEVRAQLYYAFAQVPDPLMRFFSTITSLTVRTTGDPLALVEPLRRGLRGPTGDQVLYEVRTMEQLAQGSLAQQRFLLLVGGIFAGLALLLACIGIYGVLAYLINQRRREIGVRMAVGASAGDVVLLVFRQVLGMLVAGLVVGVPAALAVARLLEGLVAGMRATDPVTLGVIVAVIVCCGLLAAVMPARRAGRIDPVAALQQSH